MGTDAVSAEAKAAGRPKSRVIVLITIFNLILLAALLYKTFGQALTPSGGVTLALYNDTLAPMIDFSLEYPGDKLTLPRLGPKERVGHSLKTASAFDAILTFKDEDGHPFKEKIAIRPLEELLILIYIEPVLEEAVVKTADGGEEKVIKASSSKVRILTSYQRPIADYEGPRIKL